MVIEPSNDFPCDCDAIDANCFECNLLGLQLALAKKCVRDSSLLFIIMLPPTDPPCEHVPFPARHCGRDIDHMTSSILYV